MVASNLVDSYAGEFFSDTLDVILHPRDGPGSRDLLNMGYECIGNQRRGLNRTEIWVQWEDGRIRDIRALDYALGGIFRIDSPKMHFDSADTARQYFISNGVTRTLSELILPHIKIRQESVTA